MVYENNLVWYTFWEELTELIFVALVGAVLWIFRHRLFQDAVPGNRSITLSDILFYPHCHHPIHKQGGF